MPVEPWVGELDCSSRREDRRGRPVQAVGPHEERQPTEAGSKDLEGSLIGFKSGLSKSKEAGSLKYCFCFYS